MARYGIVIDLNRCTGCMTCVIACKQENLTRPNVWWNRLLEIEKSSPDQIIYLRYACMHCDDPPCLEACSARAISKRSDGIVIIDHEKCVGTGDCVKACPYGVMSINPDEDYFPDQNIPYRNESTANRIHPTGKATTCTMCAHLIDQGKIPACVAGCPSKAMTFGDLENPESSISRKISKSTQLLSYKGSNPGVYYIAPAEMLEDIEKRIKTNPDMNR